MHSCDLELVQNRLTGTSIEFHIRVLPAKSPLRDQHECLAVDDLFSLLVGAAGSQLDPAFLRDFLRYLDGGGYGIADAGCCHET